MVLHWPSTPREMKLESLISRWKGTNVLVEWGHPAHSGVTNTHRGGRWATSTSWKTCEQVEKSQQADVWMSYCLIIKEKCNQYLKYTYNCNVSLKFYLWKNAAFIWNRLQILQRLFPLKPKLSLWWFEHFSIQCVSAEWVFVLWGLHLLDVLLHCGLCFILFYKHQ